MGEVRTLTLLAAVVLLLACASSSTERARQAQQNLVGAPLATVTACLGEAPYAGDEKYGEVVAYLVPLGGSQFLDLNALFPRQTGRGGYHGDGERGTERSGLDPASDLAGGVPPGSCLLVFALADGVVREVNAQGRTLDGMNGDAECALLLDRCETASTP